MDLQFFNNYCKGVFNSGISILAKVIRLVQSHERNSRQRHLHTILRCTLVAIDTWEVEIKRYAEYNLFENLEFDLPIVGNHDEEMNQRYLLRALRTTMNDMKTSEKGSKAQVRCP